MATKEIVQQVLKDLIFKIEGVQIFTIFSNKSVQNLAF